MRLSQLAGILLCPLLAAQALVEARIPTFANGELNALNCRVVKRGGKGDFACWLVVEVHNTGTIACEPIAFEVTLPAKRRKDAPRIERFERTKMPRAQRFGRPVLAGKKQLYHVATGLVGDKRKYSVRVVHASFHDGATIAKPTLLAGKAKQVQATSLAGTFPITRVALHNPLAHDLDALFLVTLTQPKDLVELYAVRLAAGQQRDWDIYSRPGAAMFLHPEAAPGCAMRATKFELVDWVLAAPPDTAAAKQQWRKAYRSWLRWPDDKPTMRGNYEHRRKRNRFNTDEYDDEFERGVFAIAADGTVTIEGETKTGADDAIVRAFADVHRKPVDQVIANNKFYVIDENCIEIQGTGFQTHSPATVRVGSQQSKPGAGDYPWYSIANSRFAGKGMGEWRPSAWQTRDFGSGYVVTRKSDGTNVETFDYAALASLVVPTRWTTTTTYGDKLNKSEELTIRGLTHSNPQPIKANPPTGEGAAALRKVWQAAARITTKPITVTADLEVQTPGTDLIWHGLPKVRGKLHMVGIGRHCTELTLDLLGKAQPEVERALASAVYDRFLLWYGKDLNDRPPFDQFFAGARIDKPTSKGLYRVHDGHVTGVHVRDGLIQQFDYEGDRHRTFTHKRFADRMFVTSFSMGKAQTKITLTEIQGHVLPSKLHFVQSFGRDWGPETLTLRNLRIR